jgi:hydroxymethylbilane synthase
MGETLVRAEPGLSYRIVHITTTGDRRRAESLPDIGGKGLFTQELEAALLAGEIDLAVHSLKDLPTDLPDGLAVLAVPERAPVNDALIAVNGTILDNLPDKACVGTSSLRRGSQLRRLRPDLRIENIRGNVDTRLRKVREGQYDAAVLAQAGLVRLGLGDAIAEVLPVERMLPAPGQGALAVEGRRDDERVAELAARITNQDVTAAVTAERTLLELLGGGCSLPLGAYAEVTNAGRLRLRALFLCPDGSDAAAADVTGSLEQPQALARAAADELRRQGADAILEQLDGPAAG